MDFLFDHLKQWPLPLLIFLVGFIWGVTNPLLSMTSKPDDAKTDKKQLQTNFVQKILNWLPFLIVFGINQVGSLFNIILLGIGDLATIAPFTNTIGFMITAFVEAVFFSHVVKRKMTLEYVCGLLCIAVGTWIAMT
jgi:hypothetical protein